MRSRLAETSSDTLRVTHRGAAIHGSRVVVEGTIEHLVVAPAVAASAALVASAPVMGSAAEAAASAPAASAPHAASDVKVGSKPAAPKKISTPAAAECMFHGETLNAFRWLAPAKLVAPVPQAAGAAS
jgi:hypothetical protein